MKKSEIENILEARKELGRGKWCGENISDFGYKVILNGRVRRVSKYALDFAFKNQKKFLKFVNRRVKKGIYDEYWD